MNENNKKLYSINKTHLRMEIRKSEIRDSLYKLTYQILHMHTKLLEIYDLNKFIDIL